MIIEMKPLNLSEVKELVKDLEEKKEIKDYLKKFGKLSKEKAAKLSKDLKSIDNIKINSGHISKIVDFLPRDSEDLSKIFNDVSLDEKEINEILDIVREY